MLDRDQLRSWDSFRGAGSVLEGEEAIVLGVDDQRVSRAAETYIAALDADARRTLLGILTSPPEIRAEAIGRLHARDDGADLTELLIELEEKAWARQWFVERLRGG